jgi:hypothetical protein
LSKAHHTDYNEATTARCERALVTLLGDLGPWRERVYLAGGLAPRYIVGQLPDGAHAHVGTTDVDLVIGLALSDETPETYRTLQNNLDKAGSSSSTQAFVGAARSMTFPSSSSFCVKQIKSREGASFDPKGSTLVRS